MKVTSVTITTDTGSQFNFDESKHKNLHLLVKDGQIIPNFVENGEQISYAYPVSTTIVRYVRPV